MKTRNKNTGSAQAARLPKSLEKDYFRLDDRSAQDMIVAAHEYARLLRYYNLNNIAEGDWSCFWRADYITLLATVAALDTDELRRQYESIDTQFGEALEDYDPDENPAQADPSPGYYKQLLQRLRDMAEQLERLYLDLKAAQLPLADTLLQLIRQDNCCDDQELQGTLARLIRLHKAGDDQLSYQTYQIFFTDDNRWGVAGKKAYDGLMTAADLDRVQLRAIFVSFLNTFVYLKNKAQQAYDDALTVRPQVHPPHVALFLTFLNLFKHLQDDLNDLTTEHLDFYYEKVLGFERRPAQPDQAYLAFTLAKEFNHHLLAKGTTLLAGKENGRPMFFETLRDWSLSQAKVEEAKSVEMRIGEDGQTLKLSAVNLSLKSSQKEASTNDGHENSSVPASIELSDEEHETGFVLASPQLLLREGNREIIVRISDAKIPLSGLRLSTKQNWSEKFPAECETIDDDSIALPIPIDNSMPIVKVVYDNINGQGTTVKIIVRRDFPGIEAIEKNKAVAKLPAIKFVTDVSKLQTADYKIQGSSVTISVGADNMSRSLILQNDMGIFNGTQQLQPFGPTALRGSHFFLGSDEAFTKRINHDQSNDKYIDKIQISIDWLGKLIGGTFSSHYSSYSNVGNIDGSLKINYLKNGEFVGNISSSLISSDKLNDAISHYGSFAGNNTEEREKEWCLISKYDSSINRGFLRITFEGDLLHDVYAKEIAIKAAELSTGIDPNVEVIMLLQHISLALSIIANDNNHLKNKIALLKEIIREEPVSPSVIVEKIQPIIADLRNISSDNTSTKNTILETLSTALRFISDAADKQKINAISDILPLTDLSSIINQMSSINSGMPPSQIINTLSGIYNNLQGISNVNNSKVESLIVNYNNAFNYFSEEDFSPVNSGNDLPNAPFTPVFNSIQLGYTSQNQLMEDETDEFFLTYPFGGYEKKSFKYMAGNNQDLPSFRFLPSAFWLFQFARLKKRSYNSYRANIGSIRLDKSGMILEANSENNPESLSGGRHIYIGLSNLNPGSTLSLIIELSENGGALEAEPPILNWYYFSAEQKEWMNFLPEEITIDQTRGLTRTGIIEFRLPNDIGCEGNTLLDPNLFWLRATAEEDTTLNKRIDVMPDIFDIRAGAVEARFVDEKHDAPPHLAAPLPPYTISKLALSDAAIKKIEQPLPSFNGRLPESAGTEFYRRVSERLRHKDRAITPWDYERLLLEQYPSAAKALCISHATGYADTYSACEPGHVVISVIPDLSLRTSLSPEPRFSKGDLDEMRDYLTEKANIFLDINHIHLVNPHYVPVCIKATVSLRDGFNDREYYKRKLDSDLKVFLVPWMVSSQNAPFFGKNVVRKSAILHFIEALPYVDKVFDYDVFVFTDDPDSVDKIENLKFKFSDPDIPEIQISNTNKQNIIALTYPYLDKNLITNDVEIVVEPSPSQDANAWKTLWLNLSKYLVQKKTAGAFAWSAEETCDEIKLPRPYSIATTSHLTGDETDHYITVL